MYSFFCIDCGYRIDDVDDVILAMEWHFHYTHNAPKPVRPATLAGRNGGTTHVIELAETASHHRRHLRAVPDHREQPPSFT